MRKTNRPTQIMLTGIHGMFDNGEVALLVGAISSIRQEIPDAQFYTGSIDIKRDESRLRAVFPDICDHIRLIGPMPFAGARLPWSARVALLLPRYILPYWKCDIGVHVGADGFSDEAIGGPLATVTHCYQLLLGYVLRKPVVACAQSIGPFNNIWTRLLSRLTLNRVNLITTRERITEAYLNQIGVTKPIYPVADLAFLVEPSPKAEVDDLLLREGIPPDRPLACVAPSQIVHHRIQGTECEREKAELYVKAMADVVDCLTNKGASVVLVCQTTGERNDDRVVADQIHRQATHKPCIVTGDTTPQEIKGLMGRSELMVSSKLHSAILAASMGTPTVVVGYAFKVYGIVGEMMGQQDRIVDIRTSDFSEFKSNLLANIEECWLSRERIRKELQQAMPGIRRNALRNAELVVDLLEKSCKK